MNLSRTLEASVPARRRISLTMLSLPQRTAKWSGVAPTCPDHSSLHLTLVRPTAHPVQGVQVGPGLGQQLQATL